MDWTMCDGVPSQFLLCHRNECIDESGNATLKQIITIIGCNAWACRHMNDKGRVDVHHSLALMNREEKNLMKKFFFLSISGVKVFCKRFGVHLHIIKLRSVMIHDTTMWNWLIFIWKVVRWRTRVGNRFDDDMQSSSTESVSKYFRQLKFKLTWRMDVGVSDCDGDNSILRTDRNYYLSVRCRWMGNFAFGLSTNDISSTGYTENDWKLVVCLFLWTQNSITRAYEY